MNSIRWMAWMLILIVAFGLGACMEDDVDFSDGDDPEDGDDVDGDAADGDFDWSLPGDGDGTDGDLPDGDKPDGDVPLACPGTTIEPDNPVEDSTVDSRNNWSDYSCLSAEENGPEKLYRFVAPACEGTLNATVDLSEMSADLDLLLLDSCNPADCTRFSNTYVDERIAFSATPGEDYYIVVDGFDGAAGSFTLELTFDCQQGTDGDSDGDSDGDQTDGDSGVSPGANCADPLPLTLSNGDIAGNTSGGGNDFEGSCQSNNGSDRVYVFTVAETIKITFEASGFDTVMYLRSDCDDTASQIACDDDGGASHNARISEDLDPGTYYLIVDGFGENEGAFTLNTKLDCPAGEVYDPGSQDCVDDPCEPNPCSAANQSVCVYQPPSGHTCDCDSGYVPDGAGGCMVDPNPSGETCSSPFVLTPSSGSESGSTVGAGNYYAGSCVGDGPEHVYSVTLTETVMASIYMDGYDTGLYIRRDCDNNNTEVKCNDDGGDGSDAYIALVLDPGDYSIFADSYGDGGNYTLIYSFNPDPCASDPCPAEADCVPDADWSEYTCVCAEGYVAYEDACIDDPCTPNLCASEHQHICRPVLPSGYACDCDPGWISDGAGGCMVDPDPSGETCAEPLPLDILASGSTSDTTAGAGSNYNGECGGSGPERVYGFVLDEPMYSVFEMSGFDTVLHLRSECDNADSQLACDDDGGPSSGSHLARVLEAGPYYLFADSYGSTGGTYNLTYQFNPDPCADDPCPGLPECVAAADWSSYECVCPAGMVPWEESCVDDPCEPNLCTDPYMNRCVMDGVDQYHCECNLGYISDGAGGCIVDPDANDWAFFVFLNADNNLEDDGWSDVAEMVTGGGSNPYVHIVVMLDTYSGPTNTLYITDQATNGNYETLVEHGELNLSDYQTMADFGVWAVEHYPARHYAFIAWDHGAGWEKRAPQDDPLTKGFSNDDHGSGAGEISISNGDYARAMAQITAALGDKLDVVGFDACLMGMWEVAAATAPFAHYLVASGDTEPAWGWSYDLFMPGLVGNPDLTPLELATSIVDTYHEYSPNNGTLAVVDLDTIDDLNDAMSDFADALMDNPSVYTQLGTIRNATESFYGFYDIMHFALQVAASGSMPQVVKDAAQALVTQLEISIAYNQSHFANSHGLTAYFPNSSFNTAYQDEGAVWSHNSTWDEFLIDYTD